MYKNKMYNMSTFITYYNFIFSDENRENIAETS